MSLTPTETRELDRCDCNTIHEDVVADAQTKMLANNEVQALANLFKVFGDPTRVKIIQALVDNEMCVCDIAVLLCMTKSSISHQLRVLRQAHLVKFRKEGKVVYYSLDDGHIEQLLKQGLEHVRE